MNGLALMTVEVTISDLRNTMVAFGGPQHEGADAMASPDSRMDQGSLPADGVCSTTKQDVRRMSEKRLIMAPPCRDEGYWQ
jgi:hypothetical protein